MLVHGADIESAMEAVRTFFDETLLLRYDSLQCRRDQSCSAIAPQFWQKIDEAMAQNRQVLEDFVGELEDSGVRGVKDLNGVPQGYQSKILHIVTHFLDGFIGIDSVFYNLADDSHWLPEKTRQLILANPDQFWLIHVETAFIDRKTASLI